MNRILKLFHASTVVTLVSIAIPTFTVVSLSMSPSCASAPVTLSPIGTRDFNNKRVLTSLDLLRDIAVDANAQVPPLLSTETTKKIVTFHRSAIVTINASRSGWKATVLAGLDEAVKNIPPADAQVVAPYVLLAKTLIQEVAS